MLAPCNYIFHIVYIGTFPKLISSNIICFFPETGSGAPLGELQESGIKKRSLPKQKPGS